MKIPSLAVPLTDAAHWGKDTKEKVWLVKDERSLVNELIRDEHLIDGKVRADVVKQLVARIREQVRARVGRTHPNHGETILEEVVDNCKAALSGGRGNLLESLRVAYRSKLNFLIIDAVRKFRRDALTAPVEDEESKGEKWPQGVRIPPAPRAFESRALEDLDEIDKLATPDQAAVIKCLMMGYEMGEITAALGINGKTIHNRVAKYTINRDKFYKGI